MTTLRLCVLLLITLPGIALGRDAREQQRIDFLLESVGKAKGIVFIRSGSEYRGAEAENICR